MKKKYLNRMVLIYLLFLSVFTVEMIFEKIHETECAYVQDTMMIEYGDDNSDNLKSESIDMEKAISSPRTIKEKELIRKYVYQLSRRDYETLTKVVEAEAGCEDENGKLLVANVVLNRVNSKKFPTNVHDVVYQATNGKIQFATAYNGSMNRVKVSKETERAVERAMFGEDLSKGALYFISSSAITPDKRSWFYNNLFHIFDYGRHSFFK